MVRVYKFLGKLGRQQLEAGNLAALSIRSKINALEDASSDLELDQDVCIAMTVRDIRDITQAISVYKRLVADCIIISDDQNHSNATAMID